MKSWVRRQFRKKPRVYILPTKMGGYLIGLIFLMFLLSIGYNNNLLLIFTLLLFAFNLMWLVQTNFHLHHLRLDRIQVSDGFAGELRPVVIHWKKSPTTGLDWNFVLEAQGLELRPEHPETTEAKSTAEVKLPHRGLWNWQYLRVDTDRPFGLYRTWKYFEVREQSFSYPAIGSTRDLRYSGAASEGDSTIDRPGTEDLRQLLPYQGNESRPISWKHYAKSGELLIREGEEVGQAIVHVRLELPAAPELKESYLSDLAFQLTACHRKQIPFIFETPDRKRGPACHTEHLNDCLKVLATC